MRSITSKEMDISGGKQRNSSWFSILQYISSLFQEVKGAQPISISQIMTPKAHQSTSSVQPILFSISGAMQSGVPTALYANLRFLWVCELYFWRQRLNVSRLELAICPGTQSCMVSSMYLSSDVSVCLHSPKSLSLMCPLASMSTLSGLISRWMQFFLWMLQMASTISAAKNLAYRYSRTFLRMSRFMRSPPPRQSMTRQRQFWSWKEQSSSTIHSPPSARMFRSALRWPCWFFLIISFFLRHLMATILPVFFSRHSLTSPNAPRPITQTASKFFLLIFSLRFLRSCIWCWMMFFLAFSRSSMVRFNCLTFSSKTFQCSLLSSSFALLRLYFFSMQRLTSSAFCLVASLIGSSAFIIIQLQCRRKIIQMQMDLLCFLVLPLCGGQLERREKEMELLLLLRREVALIVLLLKLMLGLGFALLLEIRFYFLGCQGGRWSTRWLKVAIFWWIISFYNFDTCCLSSSITS